MFIFIYFVALYYRPSEYHPLTILMHTLGSICRDKIMGSDPDPYSL